MAYSESSYESSKKYKASKIKRIPLDVQIELYEEIKQTADSRGETVNGFIKRAIKECMDQDRQRTAGRRSDTGAGVMVLPETTES